MGYHKRICEGDSDELRCYSGEIDIISASYGRQRRGVCRYKDHNTNCRASNALWVVRHRCQGQRSCMLYAENSEFGGDPCVDIGKYIEVGIELIVPVGTFLVFLYGNLPWSQRCFNTSMIRTPAFIPLGVRILQVDCFVLKLNNLWTTTRYS